MQDIPTALTATPDYILGVEAGSLVRVPVGADLTGGRSGADTGLVVGTVSQGASNGGATSGLRENTDATTATGITYPSLQFLIQHFNPTSSPTGAIRFAAISRYEYESSQSNSGAGHHVAQLDWYVQQGTGNPNLAFAHEAKFDNEVAATITTGVGSESQLASNAGTITSFYGGRSRVTGNAGTISNFYGYQVAVSANSGTVGTVVGFNFSDLTSITGITAKYSFLNQDADAPALSAAPIIDQSITYASPSATGFTVNIGARKQIALLTPAAAYAAGTINFPPKASLYDSQTAEITCSQAVTAVTWGANGAAFVLNGPSGLTAGQTVRFRYFGTIDWWVRV